ncbi:hypothetical protein PRZ48_005967 [Zasmidium cellare]|uniref:alpha-amylase n=1 Tax=Zasmidium cellare TaxID=395010 RepID=A0ABR0EM25_ZASCE|nr:hypothetical protein PRZ48_005967 [Zasmidium cellare]
MTPQSHLGACLSLLCYCFVVWTSAASLDDFRARTIYQVLTDRFARPAGAPNSDCDVTGGKYCGGTWKGITQNLDYIQGMNFDAIWISPVVQQLTQSTIDGEAYTAYWAQDLYALEPNFGTEDDLQELVQAVHDRGMYIMLDVVVNHMGYAGDGWKVDYSVFNPFNDEKYFHPYCPIKDDTNQTNVEQCWLGDNIVALADLRTEDDEVRQMYGEWIEGMIRNYTFDGLRLDTAINVEPEFFEGFVKAAGVFATGETLDGDNKFVCQWANTIGSVLNYPIYFPLTRAFSNPQGNINDLVSTIYTMKDNCFDPTAYGLFSENHDVERFASMTDDMALAKNIITYTIMGDGIPIIYQGQEQHMSGGTNPYTNRAPLWETQYDTQSELYKHIATLVQARKHIVSSSGNYTTYISDVIYQDYHTFAMRKGFEGGQVITILNNNGETTDDFEVYVEGHDYQPGTQLTEILTCTNVTVNGTGCLTVPMGQGLPKLIYPTLQLNNSGLCGWPAPPPSPSNTAVPTAHPTTINGQTTMIAADPTGDSSGSGPRPEHTKLALGSAGQHQISITIPILTAALSASSVWLFWR